MVITFRNTAVFTLILSGLAIAQPPASSPRRLPAALDFGNIPRPPMPPDPMELIAGDAQPVQDAQQRIAAIGLLVKAHKLSNIRAQPYDLKTSFIAYGGLPSDGNWMIEDAARGPKYRWTASGPNFSAVNLYPEGSTNGLYSNQPGGILPLRLLQVRSAIFFIYPGMGPQASIRTATGSLNGEPQSCVLVVTGAGSRTFSGSRNWEESEYCVDSKTGLLSQYSPAPGVFVRYDYSSGIRFHNTFIPTAFSIFENGKVVAEARTVGVTDPPAATDPMFDAAGLTPVGSGRAMNPGTNFPLVVTAPGQSFAGAGGRPSIQVVCLHGDVAGDGRLSEAEILASTDSSLNQAAMERAEAIAKTRLRLQPGATAQSSEMFLTLEFLTAGQ
ncbi:MAG TPA: hypothetical protein VKB79_21340 [Bryobacteraceae bacterium]|nr:hypothetical protein [Bryobacteraceae bacterium]